MSYGELDYALLNTQIAIHSDKSEYLEASDILTGILNRTPNEMTPYRRAFTLFNLTLVNVSVGTDKDAVTRSIVELQRQFKLMGHTRMVKWCRALQAEVDLREGNISSAKTKFQECVKHSWGRDTDNTIYCLEALGNGSRWGAEKEMSSWTTLFLGNALKMKEKLALHKALQYLADVFLGHDDPDTATSLLTVALDGFTYMDVHYSKAQCMVRLGHISLSRGDLSRALELFEEARPLFARSSQESQIVVVNEWIASITQQMSEITGRLRAAPTY
ncbi:hypothetical protein B0H13DRAFT_2391611 [Mycena leptocephala]|nr:hypothetical protein B0H13DRAFT_2391611 [Mycena leptocephala]